MMKIIDNSDWDWYEDEGYYSRFYTYDEEDELPCVSQLYSLTGWTGLGWETEDGTYVEGGVPGKLNLADKLGAVVDMSAVWKENIYNINIDSMVDMMPVLQLSQDMRKRMNFRIRH